VGIIAMGAIISMGFVGCESTDWAAVSDALNTANNDFTNAYSSNSEEGLIYTIYNNSSETVKVEDSTGFVFIQPDEYGTARFNSGASIYNVYYSPSYLNVTQSGTTFTFTD
jgi:hypothetical protein